MARGSATAFATALRQGTQGQGRDKRKVGAAVGCLSFVTRDRTLPALAVQPLVVHNVMVPRNCKGSRREMAVKG